MPDVSDPSPGDAARNTDENDTDEKGKNAVCVFVFLLRLNPRVTRNKPRTTVEKRHSRQRTRDLRLFARRASDAAVRHLSVLVAALCKRISVFRSNDAQREALSEQTGRLLLCGWQILPRFVPNVLNA